MRERIEKIVNLIARGMIAGNIIISNGGGVYVDTL